MWMTKFSFSLFFSRSLCVCFAFGIPQVGQRRQWARCTIGIHCASDQYFQTKTEGLKGTEYKRTQGLKSSKPQGPVFSDKNRKTQFQGNRVQNTMVWLWSFSLNIVKMLKKYLKWNAKQMKWLPNKPFKDKISKKLL